MSVHIGASNGAIAQRILLPGDPYRAKFIAENFLDDAVCYNKVRGMLGFTGFYKGVPVSVQGTGMGIPSASIYINELISEYGCNQLIRVGTCGAYKKDAKLLDIFLAQGACTTSAINNIVFGSDHFAPIADFSLLSSAYSFAKKSSFADKVHVGNILSEDRFYFDEEDQNAWKKWEKYGVMGVEMESAALYSLAAKYKVKALGMFTVSDHLITGEVTSSETREKALGEMIELALDTITEQ